MSKPRYKWWPYVRKIIYEWPNLREWHDDGLTQSVTRTYDRSVGSAGNAQTRAVEGLVVRVLSKQEEKEYAAVAQAIELTGYCVDGGQRLDLIGFVFWRRSHTLSGAAQKVNVSYVTAKRWQGDFIREVARGLYFL
jgi:hypothetical protein